MQRVGIRFLSFLLAITITLTSSYSYAYPTLFKTTSHAQRHVKEDNTDNALNILKDSSSISIPNGIGRIVEHFKGKEDTLIIHIQDRHADKAAQLNIAKIIDEFATKYDTHLMCLEGASKELDTSFYDKFPDGEIKEKVSEFFVEKALFTGAEYYKITNKEKYLKAFGAEDRDTYLQHLAVYKDNVVDKDRILKFLKAVSVSIDILKNRIYTKALKEIDEKSRRYAQKQIQLPEYLKTLKVCSTNAKLDISKYKNLTKFIQLAEQEEGIDFKEAESQREALIKKLSGSLDKEKLDKLLQNSLQFRLGKITQEEFYDYLKNLIEQENLKRSNYKNLLAYCDYIAFSKTINHLAVFDEAEDLEEELMLYLCQTQAQKDLVLYSKSTRLLHDLYNLKLVRKQLNYLDSQPQYSDIYSIQQFLAKSYNQLGLNLSPVVNQFKIDQESINSSKKYYKLALQRDIALVDNTLKRMQRNRKQKALLITGGFHTSGITNILKEKDISYIVICPTISAGDCEKVYSARMENNIPGISELNSALNSMLVAPLVAGDVVDEASSSGIKELFAAGFKELSTVTIDAAKSKVVIKASSSGQVYTDIQTLNNDISDIESQLAAKGIEGLPKIGFHAERASHAMEGEIWYFLLDTAREDYWANNEEFFNRVQGTIVKISSEYAGLDFNNSQFPDLYLFKEMPEEGFRLKQKPYVEKDRAIQRLLDPTTGRDIQYPILYVEGSQFAEAIPDVAIVEKIGIETDEITAIKTWASRNGGKHYIDDEAYIGKYFVCRLFYKKVLEVLLREQKPDTKTSSAGQALEQVESLSQLESEFDELMREELERQRNFNNSFPALAVKWIEESEINKVSLVGDVVNGERVYKVDSTEGIEYLVFVNEAGEIVQLAEKRSDTIDLGPTIRGVHEYSLLPEAVHEIFGKKFGQALEQVKMNDGTSMTGKIFLPCINRYANIDKLRSDFVNNPIIRNLVKKLPVSSVLNDLDHIYFVTPDFRNVGDNLFRVSGIARNKATTIYGIDKFSHSRIQSYPLELLSSEGHEFAHELFDKLEKNQYDRLVNYFLNERPELAGVINSAPAYRNNRGDDLVTEEIAYIVGHVIKGSVSIRLQDANLSFNETPIRLTDIDILAECGILPENFVTSSDEKARLDEQSNGNIDKDYLAKRLKTSSSGVKDISDKPIAEIKKERDIEIVKRVQEIYDDIQTNGLQPKHLVWVRKSNNGPRNGYINPQSIGIKNYGRETTHGCLNSIVENHEYAETTDWKGMRYTIILPVESIMSKIEGLIAGDTWIPGSVEVPKGSIIMFHPPLGTSEESANTEYEELAKNAGEGRIINCYAMFKTLYSKAEKASDEDTKVIEKEFYEKLDMLIQVQIAKKEEGRGWSGFVVFANDKNAWGELSSDIQREDFPDMSRYEFEKMLRNSWSVKDLMDGQLFNLGLRNGKLGPKLAHFYSWRAMFDRSVNKENIGGQRWLSFQISPTEEIETITTESAALSSLLDVVLSDVSITAQGSDFSEEDIENAKFYGLMDEGYLKIFAMKLMKELAEATKKRAGLINLLLEKFKLSRELFARLGITSEDTEAQRDLRAALENELFEKGAPYSLYSDDRLSVRVAVKTSSAGRDISQRSKLMQQMLTRIDQGAWSSNPKEAFSDLTAINLIVLSDNDDSSIRAKICYTNKGTFFILYDANNNITKIAVDVGFFFEEKGVFVDVSEEPYFVQLREVLENVTLLFGAAKVRFDKGKIYGPLITSEADKVIFEEMLQRDIFLRHIVEDSGIAGTDVSLAGVYSFTKNDTFRHPMGGIALNNIPQVAEPLSGSLSKHRLMNSGNTRTIGHELAHQHFEFVIIPYEHLRHVRNYLYTNHSDLLENHIAPYLDVAFQTATEKAKQAVLKETMGWFFDAFTAPRFNQKGQNAQLGRIGEYSLKAKDVDFLISTNIIPQRFSPSNFGYNDDQEIDINYYKLVLADLVQDGLIEEAKTFIEQVRDPFDATDNDSIKALLYEHIGMKDAWDNANAERYLRKMMSGLSEDQNISRKASSAGQALNQIESLRELYMQYLSRISDNPYGDTHFGQTPNKYGLIIYDSTLKGDEKEMIETIASLKGSRGNKFEIVVIPSKDGRNLIKDWKITGNISFTEHSNATETAKILSKTRPVGIIAGVEADPEGMVIEINAEKRDGKHVFVTSQEPASIEKDGKTVESFIAFEVIFADIMNKFKNYDANKKYSLAELAVILPAVTSAEFIQMIETLKHTMDELAKAA